MKNLIKFIILSGLTILLMHSCSGQPVPRVFGLDSDIKNFSLESDIPIHIKEVAVKKFVEKRGDYWMTRVPPKTAVSHSFSKSIADSLLTSYGIPKKGAWFDYNTILECMHYFNENKPASKEVTIFTRMIKYDTTMQIVKQLLKTRPKDNNGKYLTYNNHQTQYVTEKVLLNLFHNQTSIMIEFRYDEDSIQPPYPVNSSGRTVYPYVDVGSMCLPNCGN